MNINDLAVMLNVSQSQIVRHINEGTTPTKYEMEQWEKEMRHAETYIRYLAKGEEIK